MDTNASIEEMPRNVSILFVEKDLVLETSTSLELHGSSGG
jgi:hypothetical protein